MTDMSSSVSPQSLVDRQDDEGHVGYPPEYRDRYRALGWWTGQTLPAELVAAARSHWSQSALITPEVEWTYAELFTSAARLARGLIGQTVLVPGDPVMFQMGNVADTVVAYLGALFAGLRPVCTLPQHGQREITLLAEHVGARGIFVQGDFGHGQLPLLAEAARVSTGIDEVIVFRGRPSGPGHDADALLDVGLDPSFEDLPYQQLDPEQIAVFQLSGGTTGLPKVAPRMHEEYAYNARAWAQSRGWDSNDVVLYALPIMHNAGIGVGLQPTFLSGATLLLSPSASTETILGLIATYAPTSFALVPPAVAIRILEHDQSRSTDFSSIAQFIVGGQKMPQEVVQRLRTELSIDIQQKFGMAEGMFLVTPADAPEWIRHGTVGMPISPGDEIRLLQPGTEDLVKAGAVGEFCARGPYTIRGYYRAPAHNAAAFTSDGFYRTGDLAQQHIVGDAIYYSIEGRIKDVINRGAEKIHAEEVEEVMLRHPNITEAALVAMPDRVLGEKACAYLVVAPGAAAPDRAQLADFLLSKGLAKFKLPERVEIIAAMPLTNIGKIAKRQLREDIDRKIESENPTDSAAAERSASLPAQGGAAVGIRLTGFR
jgi:2,3-dihydroxybenzoate-AMP ligase